VIIVTDIAIKIEKLTDRDMIVNFYNFSDKDLNNISPAEELKTLETLVTALRIFNETKLYGVIYKGIQRRLARLLAYYQLLDDTDNVTT